MPGFVVLGEKRKRDHADIGGRDDVDGQEGMDTSMDHLGIYPGIMEIPCEEIEGHIYDIGVERCSQLETLENHGRGAQDRD